MGAARGAPRGRGVVRMKRWIDALVACFVLGASSFAQATQRVSLNSAGRQGNHDSGSVSISSDGRYVAFSSWASNFGAPNTSGPVIYDQVYVRDRWTGVTEVASVDSSGVAANGESSFPSISGDGRRVAFESGATNLGSGCGFPLQVHVHDRMTGSTELVSVSRVTGGCSVGGCGSPAISADGRFVVFTSDGADLVPNDSNAVSDVFVRDLESHTTELVSVSSSGAQGNAWSAGSAISADGRFVAFTSLASNLVPSDG